MAATEVLTCGDQAFCNHDFEKAANYYTKALTEDILVNETDLYRKRSHCYFEQESYQDALKDAYKIIEKSTSCVVGYIMCAKCLCKLNRYEEALMMYKKGLELDPDNSRIKEGLQNMQKEIIDKHEAADKQEDTTYDALKLCSQDPYPGDDELRLMEEDIVDKWKLTEFPEMTIQSPDEIVANRALVSAMKFVQSGKHEDALVCYQKAIEHDPTNFGLWLEKAELLYKMTRFKDALRHCFAIPIAFRNPDIWTLGGKALDKVGLPVTAESWLRKASRLDKNGVTGAALLFQQVRVARLYGPLTSGSSVQVTFSEFGRAVSASRSVSPGSISFTDRPVVLAQTLDTLDIPACTNCATCLIGPEQYFAKEVLEGSSLLKKAVDKFWPKRRPIPCPECGKEVYCSEECRNEDWEHSHQVLCASRNKAVLRLYEVCKQYKNVTSGDKRVWDGVWNASFSPMIMARIWAAIACAAKRLAASNGRCVPAASDWSVAKAPYRRFIAYGSASNAKFIPTMMDIMKAIFSDLGDGLRYEITQREFDGRYFQATCNVQAFSDANHPLKVFMDNIKSKPKWKDLTMYIQKEAPEATFAGMCAVHACLNHSCDNNVEVMDAIVEGRPGVAVRAKKEIKPGEELFTTYINTQMPKRQRRAWLFRAYNFWCHCPRCKFEGDGPEICTACGKKATEDKPFPGCGKCHRAWYCSTTCQKTAWKNGHKRICSTPHSETTSPSDSYL